MQNPAIAVQSITGEKYIRREIGFSLNAVGELGAIELPDCLKTVRLFLVANFTLLNQI